MCRELHHPQCGKSKRVFRLLLARCILSSFKSLSLSTFLSSPPLQKSSCHLLEESAIAAVPLQKGNTQPWEPAEKLSRFGSRWELTQILSWIWVDFQPLHSARQTLGLCLFTAYVIFSLRVCLSCFIEKQNTMLTVPQKVLNSVFSPSHSFLFKEKRIREFN